MCISDLSTEERCVSHGICVSFDQVVLHCCPGSLALEMGYPHKALEGAYILFFEA